jgi:hypothetical protein
MVQAVKNSGLLVLWGIPIVASLPKTSWMNQQLWVNQK